jgi:hypothetical protein
MVFNKKTNYMRHISRKKPCAISNREHIVREEPDIDYAEINEYDEILPLVVKTEDDHKSLEQYQIEEHIHKIKYYKLINHKLKSKLINTVYVKPIYSITYLNELLKVKKPDDFYNITSIRLFGDEDISYITDEFMKKILINPFQGLVNLIREVHFNTLYKMNSNLSIIFMRFNKVRVFTETGWKIFLKKEIFNSIITSKKDMIDEYYEKLIKMNELNVFQLMEYKRFDKILNNYIKPNVSRNVGRNITTEEKMSYRMIIDEITLLFINHYRESKVKRDAFVPFDEKILQKKNVIFS